ncbi:hypothetical protein ABGY98_003094 [Salmonella enterica]|uniref:Uncharacterized protein n=1 Tax=Salmonella enterica TaxID=28901 RepID=A0A629K9K8_SALER|nr:hypothetical protein [Salmonella enterica]EBV5863085.1 hypothetical protein [Salmonella enterica subsp. enterica serovar Bere]ECI0840735.1 hypothetical protein [Salmonella enterica subsp. diarizonae]EIN6983828.1 hypothetical protein [Salmonella enterica subsp. enterica serovar Enteritidis]MCH5483307.1 hypothetical protein [Salmonella enterica subsp. diarizonae serovar 16:z10:e,n,x,z15]
MVIKETMQDDSQQKALPDVTNSDGECSSGPETLAGTDKSEWPSATQGHVLTFLVVRSDREET